MKVSFLKKISINFVILEGDKDIKDVFFFGIPNFYKFISEFIMERDKREIQIEQIYKTNMLAENEIIIMYKRDYKSKLLRIFFEDPKICLYVLAKLSFLL